MSELKKENVQRCWYENLFIIVIVITISTIVGCFLIYQIIQGISWYNNRQSRQQENTYSTTSAMTNETSTKQSDIISRDQEALTLLSMIDTLDLNPESSDAKEFLESPVFKYLHQKSEKYLKEADQEYAVAMETTYRETLEEFAEGNKEVARVLFGYLVNGSEPVINTMQKIMMEKWEAER